MRFQPRKNKSGNKRGTNQGSMEGLKKARDSRRKGGARGKEKENKPRKIPSPLQLPKLMTGSIEQLPERVRAYVSLADTEPGVLLATVIGTILADLEDSNKIAAKAWKWLNEKIDAGNFDPKDDVKLMDALRKNMEVMQQTAVRIAEIQAKHLPEDAGDIDPLAAYADDEGAMEPEREATVQVTEEDITVEPT